ncbi:MAG: hypothetical protein AAF170_19775 [Bacteroidota bacterium]
MRPLFFAFAALLALSGCSGSAYLDGRTSFSGRASADLAPVDPARVQSAVDAAADDQDAHYFKAERTLEHIFTLPRGNVWIYLEDVRGQYVVLDPESERMTTFQMRLPRRADIEDAFFRVTSPAGIVETFTRSDLIRERDGDRMTYKLAYRGIERGSVIEEAFRIRHEWDDSYQPPLYHDIRLQQSFPTDTLTARYIFPGSWGLRIKQTSQGRVPPMSIEELADGRRILEVGFTDLPAFTDEPYAPFYKEVAPYWEFAVNEIASAAGMPSIYSAPDSWEEYADEWKDFAFRRGGLFSDPVRRKLGDILVDDTVSDSAKVAQITTWVQTNIELGGDANNLGGVLRDGEGDIYRITSLTQALLDEAGVDTSFLLIHPASEGYFDRTFIHDGQFQLPAVLARVPGQDYVIFPYIDGLPFSFIPEEYKGAVAMRIDSDGFDGFITLPQPRSQTYTTDNRYEIKIDEDGIVHVDETATLRGFAAFGMRKRFEDLTEEERETEARELLTYTETEVDDFTYELIDEEDPNAPLGIRLAYTIDDLVTVTPEEVIFQTGGLLSPASLKAFAVDPQERQLPIRIYNEELTTKRLSIQFPETWTLTTDLDNVNERNRFGQALANYTITPGEILGMQRIRLSEASAPASQYRTLLQITGARSKLHVPTLVFSTVPQEAGAGE